MQALSNHEEDMAHRCEACFASLFWRSMHPEGTSTAVHLVQNMRLPKPRARGCWKQCLDGASKRMLLLQRRR